MGLRPFLDQGKDLMSVSKWKGGHPDDRPVLVLKVLRVSATASLRGAVAGGPGVMEPSLAGRDGGAGFTLECRTPLPGRI